MPEAHAVLAFLAAFLASWGLSLVARGMIGDRRKGVRRCPSCRQFVSGVAGLTCPACRFEARDERQLRKPARHWVMTAAGAAVILIAIVCGYLSGLVYAWTHRDPDLPLARTAWTAAAFAVALFWTCTLVWAFRGERARGRRRCPRCWYDMDGGGLTCPECGHQAGHTSELYRPRRRRRWAAVALLGIVASVLVYLWPVYKSGGVVALTPNTVMVAGFQWWPDSFIYGAGGANDWSLGQRYYGNQLREWQRGWLQRKAQRTLRSSKRLDLISRCLRFAGEIDADLRSQVQARLAESITSSTDEQANQAAELLLWHSQLLASFSDQPLPQSRTDHLARWITSLQTKMDDPSPRVSMAACALLAQRPEHAAAAVSKAADIAVRTGGNLRWMARHVLRAAAGSSEGQAAIYALHQAEDPVARMIAIQSTPLALLERPEFLSTYERLLLDPDPRLAEAAAQFLRVPHKRMQLPPLVRAFHTAPDEARRSMLYSFLATFYEYTPEELAEEFRQMLSSDDAQLRQAVIDLLRTRAENGERQAFLADVMVHLAADPNSAIAADAAQALEAISRAPPPAQP